MARNTNPDSVHSRPEDERDATGGSDPASNLENGPRPGAIPEFIRRAMALGLSSFFTTEEAVRKALGDTLPQDWLDFASEQSERTRSEFMDRLSTEFGKVLANVDLAELAERLLEGRTLEIRAQIRVVEREPTQAGSSPRRSKIDLRLDTRDEENG